MALYGRMRDYSEDGTGETNRCFLVRSDDGGDNWDYYGTLAYDPNNIIDYEEAGVVRLDKEKNVLWEYRVPKGHDNHSCQPLPHGGFLLGECGKDALWMLEIDKNGKEFKRVRVVGAPADVHHAFRMVRKTPQGTYLGTLMKSAGGLAARPLRPLARSRIRAAKALP